MKAYTFVFGLVGLLLFIASGLFNILAIKTITLKIDELLLNLSATMFSISLLTLMYRLLGEEPAIKLLNDLMSMLKSSKKMHQLGIEDFNGTRSEFGIADIHSNFSRGEFAFIASRNFSAIKHARVKELFTNMLKSNKKIRIIIRNDATRGSEIKAFRDSLDPIYRQYFEVKESKNVICGMYGNEKILYVTFPLHKFSGDESPSFLCTNIDNTDSVYRIFAKEFDYLWENSSSYI